MGAEPDLLWMKAERSRRFRFGIFELDPRGGELWETATWQRAFQLESADSSSSGFVFTFSPDSKWLAYAKTSANNFRRIILWSMESNKKTAKADTALLLTAQDTSSRFFGKGRINKER